MSDKTCTGVREQCAFALPAASARAHRTSLQSSYRHSPDIPSSPPVLVGHSRKDPRAHAQSLLLPKRCSRTMRGISEKILPLRRSALESAACGVTPPRSPTFCTAVHSPEIWLEREPARRGETRYVAEARIPCALYWDPDVRWVLLCGGSALSTHPSSSSASQGG